MTTADSVAKRHFSMTKTKSGGGFFFCQSGAVFQEILGGIFLLFGVKISDEATNKTLNFLAVFVPGSFFLH